MRYAPFKVRRVVVDDMRVFAFERFVLEIVSVMVEVVNVPHMKICNNSGKGSLQTVPVFLPAFNSENLWDKNVFGTAQYSNVPLRNGFYSQLFILSVVLCFVGVLSVSSRGLPQREST